MRKQADLRGKVSVTAPHLFRQGPIGRRQTLDGIRDAAVAEPQAIVRADGYQVTSKSISMQRFVEQDTGVVSGEWPAGTVCAVMAGREAHDQQSNPCFAKRRNGAR